MEYPVHIAGIRPDNSKCALVALAQDEFELRNYMIDAFKDGLIIVPVTLETARCSWGKLVSDVCAIAVGGKPGGEALAQRYADVLRSLASYVGAGGYNTPEVNPDEFEKKICWGIDQIASTASALLEQVHQRDEILGGLYDEYCRGGTPIYEPLFERARQLITRAMPEPAQGYALTAARVEALEDALELFVSNPTPTSEDFDKARALLEARRGKGGDQ